jgi:capsid protein
MMLTLPNNTTLTQLRAEQPTTTYGEFKQQILNEIARCLNMPRNIALGDSSGYNYSSGRLDHQIYFKSIAITQAQCEEVVLDKLFKEWYREAVLIGICKPIDLRLRQWSWAWDPAEDIDPSKSATARMTALQSGQLSFPRMYAEMGLDAQTELSQQATFLGITVPKLQELIVQRIFGTLATVANPGGKDPLAAFAGRRRRPSTVRIRTGGAA